MDDRPADKPAVVLAMFGGLVRHLMSESYERLERVATLADRDPLERFDDDRADALLGRADVLLTGWLCPPITGEVLERAPRLRLVAHAAGTVKGHVTPAVFERGIQVSSAAAANAIPVAEYTLAAILFANKNVFAARERYLRRRQEMLLPLSAGNRGKTVGIVGASRVGRLVIGLLRPFELDVVVYDPTLGPVDGAALGGEVVGLDELMARSDVVSVHAPAIAATEKLIGKAELARMRDGATIVNTARGAVIDQDALVAELASRRVNAVLDVTDPEPLPANSKLFDLPNVFLTPHIAGAAGTEVPRLANLAVDEIERWSRGEPLQHEVLFHQWDVIA
jgi:phosphoglycerate dehydrogenase-like enzyme